MDQKTPGLTRKNHLSLQDKQQIVNEWKESSLSKHEFCKNRRIITTTFYGWCKQVARAIGMESHDLAPVAVVKKSAGSLSRQACEAEAEIFLPNQAVIRLRAPVETLIAVINGLSHASHTAR